MTSELKQENLSKNIDLYNKYTMLLASIFISALTAIGQNHGHFNLWLKTSIFLFSLSLFSKIFELSFLIIHDSNELEIFECCIFKFFSQKFYLVSSEIFTLISLIGFLLGLIAVNFYIFGLQG